MKKIKWLTSFFKEWQSLFCKERQERFAFGHKKGETLWKSAKNLKKIKKIWDESFVFVSESAIHLWKRANHSCCSLVKSNHGCSFLKSDMSDLLTLTVTLLKEPQGSQSLFKMSNFEQKSKKQRVKVQRANSQPCTIGWSDF